MAETLQLQAGNQPVPKIPVGETGTIGLKEINGVILEESRRDLQFPMAAKTFKKMGNDAIIASGLSLFEVMISRTNWVVKEPPSASELCKKQAQYLRQCQDDMEHSWYSFIKEAVSFYTYGFSVHEIVLRKRRHKDGSKYDDNLYGIRKLPIRSQDTIERWEFSEDGRELKGVWQDPNLIVDFFNSYYWTSGKSADKKLDKKFLRRNKFLLFTADSTRGNPQGKSPLLKCYYAWKYRTAIEEQEAIGVTRDLGGIPRFKIPSRYLANDASEEEKATTKAYTEIGKNIQSNEQAYVIVPSDRDESGELMFDFDLISSTGAKQYDTGAIISRYNNTILQALWADVLQMGQSGVGSYSLSDTKTSLVTMAVQDKLIGMRETLKELRDTLFRQNGWSLEGDLPYWDFEELESQDLDALSKAVQRIVAVGAVEVDREILNITRTALGAKPIDAEEEPRTQYLPAKESKSGAGMESGLPSGTGDATGNSGNSSTSNKENT
jgi:hypothetical protein